MSRRGDARTQAVSDASGPGGDDRSGLDAGGVARRVIAALGAMFLMAMSAAGPGFITQTATFTKTYKASFAAAILASVVIDIVIQLNVWRVIGLSGRRAQDLANTVLPRSGYVLAALVAVGGLVFGIGNISGAGLGLHDLVGIDARAGAIISAVLAIVIFSFRGLNGTVDVAVIAFGVVKIGLIAAVAVLTSPPVGEAVARSVDPHHLAFLPVLTLIGGTVGGYITYAGAHRLIESGTTGREHLRAINRGSIAGVLITGVLRVLLFLGILGVVSAGVHLSGADPAGDVFRSAAGSAGLHLFGMVFWAAGMTSTIGAAFTSASFIKTLAPPVERHFTVTISSFITAATILYLILGQTPTSLLIFAGAFNGLILPFGLAIVLWIAWRRRDLLMGYRYPPALLVAGVVVFAFTVYAGWESIKAIPSIFS